MAVRAFEFTEPQPVRLTVIETGTQRRQDVRRLRQRWMLAGVLAMGAPFLLAVTVVGILN